MSNVYFIGGAPRTGKTTALQELVKRKPMPAASTDAIRSVALGLASPDTNPRLFRVERGSFGSEQHIEDMVTNPDKVLGHEIASAEETWKSVLDFISYYQRDGKDVAIEGVAILPAELNNVDFEFKAVFISNPDDPTENILNHMKDNLDDWLNKYDEATIRAYCKFIQRWNQYYVQESKKYSFDVVEFNSNKFEDSIDSATNFLVG